MTTYCTEYCTIAITFPDETSARRIADYLLDKRLVACVQLTSGVDSLYVWNGKRETATEWLATAKTRTDRAPAIIAAVTSLHPYECPQIVATPIIAGYAPYLAWIDECVS